jgi:membrane dipeptidase
VRKLTLTIILVSLSCQGQPGNVDAPHLDLVEKAEKLAQETIIIDTHIDVPYRLTRKDEDISQRTDGGDFDFVRARSGGLDCAFMSVYVPAAVELDSARKVADQLIDRVLDLAHQWPDKFVVAYSPDDVIALFGRGVVSLPMGMENGSPIGNDLSNLTYFHERGIRYITLTHSEANQICDSSYDPERIWGGLSPFGREVVPEMNRVGIMVDVSHVTDEAFFQVLELTRAPVIASHSSCRHFTPGWERNMSDEMIQALAENGGVIQINFGSMFLNADYQRASSLLWEYLQEEGIDEDSEEAVEIITRFKEENPLPKVSVSEIATHIGHVVKLAGIDHVGLGSDFDGVGDNLPVGMEDVSKYPKLIEELLKAGYSESDIEKICSGNLLRVWMEVEAVAAGR